MGARKHNSAEQKKEANKIIVLCQTEQLPFLTQENEACSRPG